jgi:hypothetical protein
LSNVSSLANNIGNRKISTISINLKYPTVKKSIGDFEQRHASAPRIGILNNNTNDIESIDDENDYNYHKTQEDEIDYDKTPKIATTIDYRSSDFNPPNNFNGNSRSLEEQTHKMS